MRDDLVDVVEVFLLAAIGDAKLAVGCLRGAVAVGKIVDDDLDKLLLTATPLEGRSIGEVSTEVGNLRDAVEPGERGDVRNASSLSSQTRVGDVGCSSLNLRSVVWA